MRGSVVRGLWAPHQGGRRPSLPGSSFEPGLALSLGHQEDPLSLGTPGLRRATELALAFTVAVRSRLCKVAFERRVSEFLKPSAAAATHFPEPLLREPEDLGPTRHLQGTPEMGPDGGGSRDRQRGPCRPGVRMCHSPGGGWDLGSQFPEAAPAQAGGRQRGGGRPSRLTSRPCSEPCSSFEATAPRTANGRGGRHRLRSSSKLGSTLGQSGEREPGVLVLAGPPPSPPRPPSSSHSP